MTCEKHGGGSGSIFCKFCDAEQIEEHEEMSDTPLTPYGIEQLKIEHNSLVLSGRTLLAEIENLARRVNALREQIKTADPDEYDEIRLLFEGEFQVNDDEQIYRELTQEEKDYVDGDH